MATIQDAKQYYCHYIKFKNYNNNTAEYTKSYGFLFINILFVVVYLSAKTRKCKHILILTFFTSYDTLNSPQ